MRPKRSRTKGHGKTNAKWELFGKLVVHVNNPLDLIITAQENPAPVVNMLWHNIQQSLHARVDRLAARILKDHRHWRALIQDPELALGTLRVGWVGEDTAV